MPITNPIQYVSRTFLTILNDINSDDNLVDKPVWFKRVWAGVGDVISMWINAEANNRTLRTAFTRNSTKDIVELIDYSLTAHTTSSGEILFFVDTSLGTGIYPFTVQSENLIANSLGSLTLASKRFEARANSTFTLVSDTFTTNYAVNNELTISTDFEYTGHKVRLTSTTTLPSPLQADKDYYTIYVSATKIKLAESLLDAYAGNEVSLNDNGTGTHTVNLFSKAITVYQQNSREDVIIGTSDGSSEWQEFDLPDNLILDDTLTISINSVTWTAVDSFIDSTSSSTHYKIFPKNENQFAIRFGNGTYGKIPGTFDIYASYSYGGGTNSNVTVINNINSYAGSNSNIKGVSNPQSITGGDDEESIESAKRLAPILLKARDRFITESDGEALALNYGGISYLNVIGNDLGVLSANIFAIATGGGLYVDSGNALRDYLISKTILESITVVVNSGTSLITVAVTSAAKVLSGYTYSDIDDYFELAYLLFLSEAGKEIYDTYTDDGITDAITLINTIFSKAFSTTDQTTLDQIERLISNLTYRETDETIQESDVFGYIDSYVDGIDYITITTFGTGLPLTVTNKQMTTPGTLTLTEIP